MKEVERIIRVDHAGERGAISIYKSQKFFAKFLYKDLVPELDEMLNHEQAHFETFDVWLKERNIRSCYALILWSIGGKVLGTCTALLGRNAIWACTESVETTVLEHLDWQLEYLKLNDNSAYVAVHSIKQDEEEHRDIAKAQRKPSILDKPINFIVRGSTKFAIWLSTKL